MNKTALIITGGEFSSPVIDFKYEYVIACDKGYVHAKKLGIKPDLVIGDFDSWSGDIPADIPVISLPVEKDDTDTMYAVKQALERGYSDIKVLCGLGGRMDHLLANIQTMGYVAANGGVCEFMDETNHIRTLSAGYAKDSKAGSKSCASLSIPSRNGYALSLLSLTDRCEGLCIKGAKYNVENITLTNTFPLGHGNHWESDEITVSITSGILLVITSKLEA
ncbi:MAG: thiamine diphosphokinase [Lachnospiraceae bacterium]|nr:thiamine diphosphokinase [Lachnospiraceae bacterium]